jgi:predicted HicB family RNase H-like nuclease
MTPKVAKIVFTFRIDPRVKEAAKKAAQQAKLTLSRYVAELIRLDLWRKGLLR